MEDLKKVEDLFDHTREYINIRVEEAKLAVAERVSTVMAMVIAATVVNIIFLLCLIFASAAGAIAIGTWLKSYWLGFLLVAVFYFLAGLLVWVAKERLIRVPIMNAIIRQLFKNNNEYEKD
ncbi:MAG: phage holin family protein [Chitinophagaceae bacterium]|nr:phage holin family protein [Chitinophagaceae bacterium]